MSTLYLNVNVYPLPYGSTAKVFVDIYRSSHFYNDPSGSSLPPDVSPDAAATVVVAFGGTAVSLTGLDNTKGYWLRVFNPQGYSHWFPVSWTKGNSSGAGAMQVSVPAIEGPVALLVPPLAASPYTLSIVTFPNGGGGGPVVSNGRPFYIEESGLAAVMNPGPTATWSDTFPMPSNAGSGFAPYVYLVANDSTSDADLYGPINYSVYYFAGKTGTTDYMIAVSETGETITTGGAHEIVWAAAPYASSGSSFSYPGAGSSSYIPITAAPGVYTFAVTVTASYAI